jgi:RimJ/RimL family protein N-acetyltransferase
VPLTPSFEQKMAEFYNNPSRIWATVGENRPLPRAAIKRMIAAQQAGPEPGYAESHFMMCGKDGAIIGSMGLWAVEHHRFAWLSSWIGESAYWGGGYGTDALTLLVDYAFRWLDLRRLVIATMAINVRARRNVEKCGFVLEAIQREATVFEGARVDEARYALPRGAWPGRDAVIERLGLRARP